MSDVYQREPNPITHDISQENEAEADLRKLDRIARLLDKNFGIPGTKYRIGWDGIIGLIPGIGDFFGLAMLGFYIRVARKHNISASVQVRMAWTQLVDTLIGLIPFVGDLADFMHKSHVANARRLERAIRGKYNLPADA